MGSMDRRTFLSMLGLAAVASLSACSGSAAPSSSNPGAMRTYTDIDGNQVEVPENPQRVVALSEPALDGLLALGITPVGAVAGRGQTTVGTYLPKKAQDIPLLGSVSEINFEAVGAARPDLIVLDGTSVNNNPPVLETLRAIAPVAYNGYAGGDWRVNFTHLADAVNKVDEGNKIIREYDELVERTAAKLQPYADDTFSIVRWQGNSAALILKELPAGQALTDLGLRRPPAQDRRGGGHSDPVSNENLADIDADYIFFGTLGGSSVGNPNAGGSVDRDASIAALQQAMTVPGFDRLKAFQLDHILPVDGSLWTTTGGPLLMHDLVTNIEELLA